jgi:hypothetical protein
MSPLSSMSLLWSTVLSLPSVYSTAICHNLTKTLRPLYGCHLSGHLPPLWPSPPSMALCSLNCPLFPLWSIFFLNSPLSSLLPSASSTALIPSMALCPLYSPPSPLQPFVFSTALCLLYSPLSPLWSLWSLLTLWRSRALYPLYGPLSPLQPSVFSTALCLLYGPLSPLQPSVPL